MAAYVEGPATDVAIRKVFAVSQAEFERGYTTFLHKQIDAIPVLASAEGEAFDELEKAHRLKPKDPLVAARLAWACFEPRGEGGGRQVGRREPQAPAPSTAGDVRDGSPEKAGHVQGGDGATGSVSRSHGPGAVAVEPPGRHETQGRAIRRGRRALCPRREARSGKPAMDGRAGEGLPGVRRGAGTPGRQRLTAALVRFAEIEPNDLPSRKKLAELALERHDAATARRWATEALEIQAEDAEAHRLLAAALVELNELDGAIVEFEAAIEIDPAHLQQRLALADALVQAGQQDKARKVLQELLRRDPKFPGADALLESLKEKR